ncbi:MAG: arginine N-succinyltransferase [Desulfomonile tiedjei]|uniref:Arginine N-succinyltransferase n=1 Tax=Desulfomonile tiedjei TaxID=2358 RepID=A0A9D6Z178_9BACT|nr:arginine N-succinyltransferase [Desulfomonile tiedjei]
MLVIRPVETKDLDRLYELANLAGFGLTSLPKDEKVLKSRIVESVHSFAKPAEKPRGELYIFVLEDVEKGIVAGTSNILSKVGGFEPFYAYKIQTCVHESKILSIRKEIQSLLLVAEHSGPTEIGGIYLAPEYRKHGVGRLLSLFRFVFMALDPKRFEPKVIAEIRGVVDDRGQSPFWEALGRHFFDMDYSKADLLSIANKRFIADLMPTCPIYVPLLPPEAREVLGKAHEQAKPALRMLEEEGFAYSGMVDIFEAGPIVECPLGHIRTVKESRLTTVDQITTGQMDSPPFIIARSQGDFRACMGAVDETPLEGIRISVQVAETLSLSLGDKVMISPLRSLPSQTKPLVGVH